MKLKTADASRKEREGRKAGLNFLRGQSSQSQFICRVNCGSFFGAFLCGLCDLCVSLNYGI